MSEGRCAGLVCFRVNNGAGDQTVLVHLDRGAEMVRDGFILRGQLQGERANERVLVEYRAITLEYLDLHNAARWIRESLLRFLVRKVGSLRKNRREKQTLWASASDTERV